MGKVSGCLGYLFQTWSGEDGQGSQSLCLAVIPDECPTKIRVQLGGRRQIGQARGNEHQVDL